ncbi:MAG: prepilin-type N-terminal cleavage/methylation domain-containing protein [Candidatus Omnitrophica bacterium]|nr:prepilin-type N-terminal cleavage/methylation domain-containing protein [Candidatus Omnitrophota bacterium]
METIGNQWMSMKSRGYTLLEIVIVVVIVGILVSLGLVNYTNVRERALGKEARATLKLIAAAERIYRMETGLYLIPGNAVPARAANDLAYINSMLKLAIPQSNNAWGYSITSTTNPAISEFDAQAARAACTYKMTQGDDEPSDSGTCY